MASRRHLLFHILAPPAVIIFAIDRKLRDLEARYPALPVDDTTCTAALRTPNSPATQRTAAVDIYSARVHNSFVRKGTRHTLILPDNLRKRPTSHLVSFLWAQEVVSSSIFTAEGYIFGLLSGRGWDPGYQGLLVEGFGQDPFSLPSKKRKKRGLLHGALVVEQLPNKNDLGGLLFSWRMPAGLRLFFEKIARWGYPWRLMSGGRHEFSISEVYHLPGREHEGTYFDVRFSSAHDYEIVPGEVAPDKQKTIPKWAARLHRGYARWILDHAVETFRENLEGNIIRVYPGIRP